MLLVLLLSSPHYLNDYVLSLYYNLCLLLQRIYSNIGVFFILNSLLHSEKHQLEFSKQLVRFVASKPFGNN